MMSLEQQILFFEKHDHELKQKFDQLGELYSASWSKNDLFVTVSAHHARRAASYKIINCVQELLKIVKPRILQGRQFNFLLIKHQLLNCLWMITCCQKIC